MANKRSAMKAHRVSERRHVRNRSVRSAVRTYVKKARVSLQAAEVDGANAAVAEAAKVLDRAANKGVIHKNQAARRKSRLMHQLAVAVKNAAAVEVAAPARPARGRRSAADGAAARTSTTTTRRARPAATPSGEPPARRPTTRTTRSRTTTPKESDSSS